MYMTWEDLRTHPPEAATGHIIVEGPLLSPCCHLTTRRVSQTWVWPCTRQGTMRTAGYSTRRDRRAR